MDDGAIRITYTNTVSEGKLTELPAASGIVHGNGTCVKAI
jgi:hypothetical protein